MVLVQNLLASFCYVHGKDSLRHFPVHGGLGLVLINFSHISINFKRTAISWHFRKQVGVIAYPMCQRLRPFLACQEDKTYRDKIYKYYRLRYLTSDQSRLNCYCFNLNQSNIF